MSGRAESRIIVPRNLRGILGTQLRSQNLNHADANDARADVLLRWSARRASLGQPYLSFSLSLSLSLYLSLTLSTSDAVATYRVAVRIAATCETGDAQRGALKWNDIRPIRAFELLLAIT